MSTMRIAVAGTGGLACMIAHCISEETSHPVVLLSRAVCFEAQRDAMMFSIIKISPATLARFAFRTPVDLYLFACVSSFLSTK